MLSNVRISDGDFIAAIDAKDFPACGEFRVYRVMGDVTRPHRLKAAISNMLAERGIGERKVVVAL